MKLYEFFGTINLDQNTDKDKDPLNHNREKEVELSNDIFNFILDDDLLHKKFFMPVAKSILLAKNDKDPKTDSHDWKLWIPMTNAGCMNYYKEHDLKEHPTDVFTKEIRKDLCKKLANHFHEDIIKGKYKLGV
jgi:hypothetical protein